MGSLCSTSDPNGRPYPEPKPQPNPPPKPCEDEKIVVRTDPSYPISDEVVPVPEPELGIVAKVEPIAKNGGAVSVLPEGLEGFED